MPKAVWNNTVIAESEKYEIVENNIYFPEESIKKEFLTPSATHTTCHWKGIASYYNIVVNGTINKDAAWYYPEPSTEAKYIKNNVAFWKGVKIFRD